MTFSSATQKFLEQRIVVLLTVIDEVIPKNVIAQLLYLEMRSREKPIASYVTSPGEYESRFSAKTTGVPSLTSCF